MAYDRSQFRATSTKALKTLKDSEDSKIGSGDNNGLNVLDIEDGMNKIRIAPKFPDEKEFYQMVKRTWVPFEKEDGEVTNIPILDSKIHAGTEFDIIEEYIKHIKANLDPTDDKKKLALIAHWKDGLAPQLFWESYGWKIVKGEDPEFGRFEFKRTVRDELCSMSIIEDEDEAIDVDPFTDPEEGSPILLTKNSKAKKPADYYKVKLSKNPYPMTDAMFDQLLAQEPISTTQEPYTIDTFNKALEGIKIFDIDNEIDLFEDDDFQDMIATVRSQYGASTSKKSNDDEDEDDEAEEVKKPAKKKRVTRAKVEVVNHDDDDDEDDDDEDVEEVVKPKKKKAKPVVEENDDDDEDDDEDGKDDDDDDDEVVKPKKSKLSIAELRAQLAARKKK